MKEETKQILNIISHIQENMATKHDVTQLKADMSSMGRSLHADIAAVHTELGNRIDNHDGFTKEIDHIMRRVAIVENHLDLQTA